MTRITLIVAGVAAAMALACGDDEVDPNPNTNGTGDTGVTALSTAFGNQCARCHGDTGEGTSVYPSIPGANTEDRFISVVRAGRGEMPAFTSSQISDADLKNDYAWLTTKR